MTHPNSMITRTNLEAALAGEATAHVKYRWFARLCRAQGDEATARLFEATADQEVQHAWGHLELLLAGGRLTPEACLQLAIDGETYEYTQMYPAFRAAAERDGDVAALAELDAQIGESQDHAQGFATQLDSARIARAAKRFAALERVEQRHAGHYRARLAARKTP